MKRYSLIRLILINNFIYKYEFIIKITTGAYDDLKKVYELAFSLVTKFGMSEKIGFIGF